jgi:hypothetical protein
VSFDFCLQETAVLPLKFISFEGAGTAQGNVLKWVVAKDMEINKLVVERSADGISFTGIAEQRRDDFINAFSDNWEYRYIDNQTLTATGYYRIRMEDVNGRSLYSVIIRVEQRGKSLIKIYPNPANSQVRVELPGNNREAGTISLIDMNGRIINTQAIASRQAYATIDVFLLPPSLYRIIVFSDGVSQYGSFIKQ